MHYIGTGILCKHFFRQNRLWEEQQASMAIPSQPRIKGISLKPYSLDFTFGSLSLPEDYLANPMLLVKDSFSDFFMLDEFGVLPGRRIEDADPYHGLIRMLRRLV